MFVKGARPFPLVKTMCYGNACVLSFLLIYFGGENVSYNRQKNYESLDVQRRCAHICLCNKLSK